MRMDAAIARTEVCNRVVTLVQTLFFLGTNFFGPTSSESDYRSFTEGEEASVRERVHYMLSRGCYHWGDIDLKASLPFLLHTL